MIHRVSGFEAIQSRVVSYSTLPGASSGHLRGLRLQRRRSVNSHCQLSTIPDSQASSNFAPLPAFLEHLKKSKNVEDTTKSTNVGRAGGVVSTDAETQKYPFSTRKNRLLDVYLRPRGYPGQTYADIIPKAESYHLIPEELQFAAPTAHESFEQMFAAIRAGDAHGLLEVILSSLQTDRRASGFARFMTELPSSVFSEILRILKPEHFIQRYEILREEMGPILAQKLLNSPHTRKRYKRGYYKFARIFSMQLEMILTARLEKHRLSLSDCKHLLRCARAAGNPSLATRVWSTMRNESLQPDLDCYNDFLSTIVVNRFAQHDTHKFRVLTVPKLRAPGISPRFVLPREQRTLSSGMDMASDIFHEMVNSGIAGNAETFTIMVTAMARRRDMDSVKTVLKNVWGIDTEAILSGKGSSQPLLYPRSSPFYPSQKLLHAIARAFGGTGQISATIQLVDYISRHYSVPISREVWMTLLDITHALCSWRNLSIKKKVHKRIKPRLIVDARSSSLKRATLPRLWRTMTSPPYNVKPTMAMYNKLVIHYRDHHQMDQALRAVSWAKRLLMKDIRELVRQHRVLNDADLRRISPVVSEQRFRSLYFQRIRVIRNTMYLRSWLFDIIKQGSFKFKNHMKYCYRTIPNIVKDWAVYLHGKVRYKVALGTVELDIGSKKAADLKAWRRGRKKRRPLADFIHGQNKSTINMVVADTFLEEILHSGGASDTNKERVMYDELKADDEDGRDHLDFVDADICSNEDVPSTPLGWR